MYIKQLLIWHTFFRYQKIQTSVGNALFFMQFQFFLHHKKCLAVIMKIRPKECVYSCDTQYPSKQQSLISNESGKGLSKIL